jgi:hypothetical protein
MLMKSKKRRGFPALNLREDKFWKSKQKEVIGVRRFKNLIYKSRKRRSLHLNSAFGREQSTSEKRSLRFRLMSRYSTIAWCSGKIRQ